MWRGLFGLLAAYLFAAPVAAWDAVACVQAQLNALGHDAGAVDGRVGPATRRALADYEAANGTITTRPFDRFSAIVHCRQIGLRHPEARALWPATEATPFILRADADVDSTYVAGVKFGIQGGLAQMRGRYGVGLAAPFLVLIGRNEQEVMGLVEKDLPWDGSKSWMRDELTRICGEEYPRGVSLPGLIMICNAPVGTIRRSYYYEDGQALARHEVFHEAQNQLAGELPDFTEAKWLRYFGPKWLIEGSAMVFERGPLPVERAAGKYLPKLESHADGTKAGTLLYTLGHAAASVLAKRGTGLGGVLDYYERIGKGAAWRDAFTESFGVTVSDFYAGK